jgi:hypothetical protein
MKTAMVLMLALVLLPSRTCLRLLKHTISRIASSLLFPAVG